MYAYDSGILWGPTKFNAYGTPVMTIRKALLPGLQEVKLWVCGVS